MSIAFRVLVVTVRFDRSCRGGMAAKVRLAWVLKGQGSTYTGVDAHTCKNTHGYVIWKKENL